MTNNKSTKAGVPDFFGDKLSSLDSWELYKGELKDLILDTEYGVFGGLSKPSIRTEKHGINFASKAEWTVVYFDFEQSGKTHTVRSELILPKNEKNPPVFIYIDFSAETPSKYLPVEEILDGGFGMFKVFYQDITTDNGDFDNGLCALVDGGGIKYGKIAVWSYMLRTMADYLTENEITNTFAVAGHSRLGKTALLTSALDSRFSLACVNNSGCCGASLSREKTEGEENVKAIVGTFPFWFKQSFAQYVDNEDALPFDQHMLLSLTAPRNVVIGCAIEDYWADNDGAYKSCSLATPVWELYGKKGLVADAYKAEKCAYTDGNIGYYIRNGSHFFSREDWAVYMRKFREILK